MADVARRAGVPRSALRRVHRRQRQLFDQVVRDELVAARRSIFHDRTAARSVVQAVEQIVEQRINVYEAIAPVMPAVQRGVGAGEFRTLAFSLRSATDFDLSRFLVDLDADRRTELLTSIESSLTLSWLDCLRRNQVRSVAEVTDLLTDHVSRLLVQAGVTWPGSAAMLRPVSVVRPIGSSHRWDPSTP